MLVRVVTATKRSLNGAIRWGSTLRIRLIEDHDKLGAKGDVISVKAGYARNCLIPKKIATYISATELKMLEQHKGAMAVSAPTSPSEASAVAQPTA